MIAVESTKTVMRLATVADRIPVIDAFNSYLNDVARFGHDVLPTSLNAESYWGCVFEPAIREGRSFILLAQRFETISEHVGWREHEVSTIGALFWIIPEQFVAFREPSVVDLGAWVARDHRRNRIATEMREWAMQLLRKRGITSVVSTILKDNVAGLASYEKVGGKIIGYMVEIPIVKGEV